MNRLFILLFITLSIPPESFAQVSSQTERHEFSHKSMGTLFRIICYSEDAAKVKTVGAQAFKRVDSLNLIMSDYLADSELNRLSRSSGKGNYIEVSDELFEIIQLGYQWSVKSDGIFDISIGPYSQLWRRAGRKDQLPTANHIQNASESVGYNYIHLDSLSNSIFLEKPNMQLDLGGIAKGFAVDEIFKLFVQSGIPCVLIDGGGDIRAGNAPPGKKGWKIILENIEDEPQALYISNASIATSGDLYRYIQVDSIKYSHIIDPRTGYGTTIQRTVTVQANNCMDADVLASILSVWGPEEGFKLLSSMPCTKALIVQRKEDVLERFEKGNLNFQEF
jgi:thiamine biosynthesis lipoprotein